MKSPLFLFALLILALGVVPGVARADVYTSSVIMDHASLYWWQVNSLTIPSGMDLVGATLTLEGIRDWQTELNALWVHLLDTKRRRAGWFQSDGDGYENPATIDGFYDALSGQGAFLNVFNNIPATATTLTYSFDAGELAALTSYIGNGNNIAFGFDPDCHFDASHIRFDMNFRDEDIPIVPEPGSILLLGTCLLVVGGGALRRRLRA